ncbi:MAG: carbohydrate ABC transporter permease [Anaerolineae bacterium]|nr:carbohydrate ABC transporter permease [Anaerolineae bacterium]
MKNASVRYDESHPAPLQGAQAGESSAVALNLRQRLLNSGRYVILILFALIAIAPFIWMWSSALKESREIFRDPFALPTSLNFENLVNAWTVGRFSDYLKNSIIITVPTTVGVVALACLAGYGLARFSFRGRRLVFYTFLLGIMVPFQSIMIPLYYNLRDYGLLGTYWAMILPAIALGQPFGIFLMQAFFRGLPGELADAARVDGCNEFQTFLRVMLPMAGAAMSALFVFQFMWTWNAFLMPLLYMQKEELRPLPLGLMFFQGRYTQDYGLIAGGVTIATVPVIVVYILFQRQFMRGLTAGALRG